MALKIMCLLSLLIFTHAKLLPLFDPRIVNGEDAEVGEIPYQISLQDKYFSSHFCGGSIVNDNYVITAAHCLVGKSAGSIKVVAATTKLDDPKSQHNVTKIIIHKEFDPFKSWINDIALLKVETPFNKSITIGPVPLPPKDHVVKTNDVAVVSGWGSSGRTARITTKLQRVNILIADQDYCKHMYNDFGLNVYPTQVCAYDPSVRKGACFGDSGGPMTVGGKLVGLVSWGHDCGSIYFPSVYTRVVSYLDWIKNNAV